MIQTNTIVNVSDNSGGKRAKCIRILGGYKRKVAKVGDTVVVSIQSVRRTNSKVRKGEVHRAVVVRTKKPWQRKSGMNLGFGDNAVVLIGNQNKSIGNRIVGSVTHELNTSGHKDLTKAASSAIL